MVICYVLGETFWGKINVLKCLSKHILRFRLSNLSNFLLIEFKHVDITRFKINKK